MISYCIKQEYKTRIVTVSITHQNIIRDTITLKITYSPSLLRIARRTLLPGTQYMGYKSKFKTILIGMTSVPVYSSIFNSHLFFSPWTLTTMAMIFLLALHTQRA